MSLRWPPITIVIPAYNLQNYIGDAIKCAAKQDYPGVVSIIVLDDGSTDETLAAAQLAAKNLPNVAVHTQANQGRVGARNRLLSLATTELVAWLDGDDMAPPDWLSQQYHLLASQEDYVAVSGQGYAMTASAMPIGPIPRPTLAEEIHQRHFDGLSNAFFQSCTLTKRSAILAAGGYRTNYPAAEDYDLWLRLSKHGRLCNSDQCHLYYRVHATSANATVGAEQRRQGFESCNEARSNQGIPPLQPHQEQPSPAPKKDDWNRRVYWINIALRSGNPWTASRMISEAIRRHPSSLLLWILLVVAFADTVLLRGNRTEVFRSGGKAKLGQLPSVSAYRLARWLNHLRKRRR